MILKFKIQTWSRVCLLYSLYIVVVMFANNLYINTQNQFCSQKFCCLYLKWISTCITISPFMVFHTPLSTLWNTCNQLMTNCFRQPNDSLNVIEGSKMTQKRTELDTQDDSVSNLQPCQLYIQLYKCIQICFVFVTG